MFFLGQEANERKEIIEMKTVDVYKHAKVEGLCIYVDPETKKLSSNLAMSVELLKVFEANPNNSLWDLISNGQFLKVCDVIMEVTKVPKVYPCQRTNCSESFNNEVDQKKHMQSCQIIPIQKQFKCKSPGKLSSISQGCNPKKPGLLGGSFQRNEVCLI